MKTIRLVIVISVVAGLLALALPALAQTAVADCEGQISNLRATTAGATFLGRNAAKDQAGLLGKLDAASVKLSQGKYPDALQALTHFRDKVADLNAQGKIEPASAATLTAGANDAIACVQNLIAGV